MSGASASSSSNEQSVSSAFDDLRSSDAFDGLSAPPETRNERVSMEELFGDSGRAKQASEGPSGGSNAGRKVSGLVGDPGAQISGGRRQIILDGNGQIKPCWRPTDRPVAVRISIILDHQGAMIGPPRIVRSERVRAPAGQQTFEAMALRAMAGCAPYSLASAAGSYRSFEIDFSKDKDWIKPTGLIDVY